MSAKDIKVCIGVDVDADAGWLGSNGGQDSPNDIQRGVFPGEVGSPRLIRLFDRLAIPTTWFTPGHSVDSFPRQMRRVADAGHVAPWWKMSGQARPSSVGRA